MSRSPLTNGDYKLSVEKRLTMLEANVLEIRDNHLSHLAEDVKELRGEVQGMKDTLARWLGGGAVLIFISQMIFAYILSR